MSNHSDKSSASSHPDSRFSCNICLECVNNPILTICGHIFCWECIFLWLRDGMLDDDYEYLSLPLPLNSSGQHNTSRRVCPVCKADCTVKTIIPIYVRDIHHSHSHSHTNKVGVSAHGVDEDIAKEKITQNYPSRPSPPISALNTVQTSINSSTGILIASSSLRNPDRSTNTHLNDALVPASTNLSSNPSLFQALLRLQSTIHNLHPSVSPTLANTNGRMQNTSTLGSYMESPVSMDHSSSSSSQSSRSRSQRDLLIPLTDQGLDDNQSTTTYTRVSNIDPPPTLSSDSSYSVSADPTTEVLSRLLLLLGSFVVLCLLLF